MTFCATTSPFSSVRLALAAAVVSLLAGCKPGEELEEPVEEDKLNLGGCDRAAVVDDGEDNDHRVIVHNDRGGYMYTYLDDAGSNVTPTAGSQGGVFAFHTGGANGSMYGGRFYGALGASGIVYAGFGANLLEPKDGYDASSYEGITFFGRRAADSVAKVRLKVPDRQTDPGGGVCSECFNDFGKDFEFTEDWKQYIVPFRDMEQMPGWGSPRPSSIDPTALYAIQLQVSTPGAHFDIWFDDISFYGCKKTEEKPEATDAKAQEEEKEEDE